MIKLYGHPQTRSTRISWLLAELAMDYDYQLISFAKGEHRSASYLAINPYGKVPALQDGELTLIESGAILTHLADKYSGGRLIPAVGSDERALFMQWAFFALSELEQPLWTMAKHRFALPQEHRIKDIFATAEWEFQRALEVLSIGLGERDYFVGGAFTAVDILLCHTLIWAQAFKQPIEQHNLQAYMSRIKGRPSLAAALAREAEVAAHHGLTLKS